MRGRSGSHGNIPMTLAKTVVILSLLRAGILHAGLEESLQTLRSQDIRPHLETVRGRQIFFVEGLPFFVLAAELPWHQSHYGRYRETMGDWDRSEERRVGKECRSRWS